MVGMKLSAPLALRSFAPALFGLALGGCLLGSSSIGKLDADDDSSGPPSDGTDTSGGAQQSGGSETTASSSGSLDASDGEVATTGEPPLACAPPSPCTFPDGCLQFDSCSGGILEIANADGCVRQTCTAPEDCAAGTTCLLPWSWGLCGHYGCSDNPEGGGWCDCGFGRDCTNNGFCMPDELGLPPDTTGPEFCRAITDSAACESSSLPAELGACRWYEGWQRPVGALCEERQAVAQCTFTKASARPRLLPTCPADESRTPMVYFDDGVATVLLVDPEYPAQGLDMDFDADSYGWLTCDVREAAGECDCACS